MAPWLSASEVGGQCQSTERGGTDMGRDVRSPGTDASGLSCPELREQPWAELHMWDHGQKDGTWIHRNAWMTTSMSLFPQQARAPLQPQQKQVLQLDKHLHSKVHLWDLLKHTSQLRRSQEGLENIHFYQVSGGRGSHWSGDLSSDHCSSRNLGPGRTKPQSPLHTY